MGSQGVMGSVGSMGDVSGNHASQDFHVSIVHIEPVQPMRRTCCVLQQFPGAPWMTLTMLLMHKQTRFLGSVGPFAWMNHMGPTSLMALMGTTRTMGVIGALGHMETIGPMGFIGTVDPIVPMRHMVCLGRVPRLSGSCGPHGNNGCTGIGGFHWSPR